MTWRCLWRCRSSAQPVRLQAAVPSPHMILRSRNGRWNRAGACAIHRFASGVAGQRPVPRCPGLALVVSRSVARADVSWTCPLTDWTRPRGDWTCPCAGQYRRPHVVAADHAPRADSVRSRRAPPLGDPGARIARRARPCCRSRTATPAPGRRTRAATSAAADRSTDRAPERPQPP